MNSLALKKYDTALISKNFYPAVYNEKEIRIADVKNDRELKFTLDSYHFETFKTNEFKKKPDNVKNIIKKSKDFFEDFEIVAPIEDERPMKNDPFLFGIKNGLKYFICAWNMDIWDNE